MMPFAGFYMPVEYTGITDEHMTVRNNAGVFDVSHMGEFWIRGSKAILLLQYITTNDVSRLSDGQVQYSCLPNGNGGILDDILVYRFSQNEYMMVVNASNIEKDWQWIVKQNENFDAEIQNASDYTAQLAIQGPNACEILQPLTNVSLKDLKYYTFTKGAFADIQDVIISATGYTGAGGVEIYFENQNAEKIWNAIFEQGQTSGIKPVGLGARDTLRLEMGYCLYGNDIDDITSPIEANLSWIVKFEAYKNFINKEIFYNQKIKGVKRKRVGFRMIDRGIPRHDYLIKDANGNLIGKVTSGSISPVLGVGIGMGYVPDTYDREGQQIFIEIRGKLLKAQIVSLPFIQPKK
jgi:aminomethyltransferase